MKRPAMQSSTLTVHHLVLSQAFDKAITDRLVTINPAKALGKQQKPKRQRARAAEVAREHCWTADEARRFLVAARAAGPQPAAFYSLALDTGMRKASCAASGGPTSIWQQDGSRLPGNWLHLGRHPSSDRRVARLIIAERHPGGDSH